MQCCILPIQVCKFESVNAAGFRWRRRVFCLALMWKIAEERVVFTARGSGENVQRLTHGRPRFCVRQQQRETSDNSHQTPSLGGGKKDHSGFMKQKLAGTQHTVSSPHTHTDHRLE